MGELFGRGALWPANWSELPRTRRLRNRLQQLLIAFSSWVALTVVVRLREPAVGEQVSWLFVAGLAAMVGACMITVLLAAWRVHFVLAGIATLSALLLTGDSLVPASVFNMWILGVAISQTAGRMLRVLPFLLLGYLTAGWLSPVFGDKFLILDDAAYQTASALAVSVVASALVQQAITADTRELMLRGRIAGDSIEGGAHEAEVRVQRMLHDDVIFALKLVNDAAGVSSSVVTAVCARAAERLRGLSASWVEGPSTLAQALREAAENIELDVTVSPSTGQEDVDLDPPVAAALVLALREATRNAHIHGKATGVAIAWRVRADVLAVTITDDGLGFDPDVSTGWGISSGMRTAVEDAGGSMHVDSAPGRGTRIRFIVDTVRPDAPSRQLERAYHRTVASMGGPRVLLSGLLPFLVVHPYVALRYSWGDPTMWQQILLTLVLSGSSFLLVRRLVQRAPSRVLVVGILAGSLAGLLYGLHLAEPHSLLTYDSWVVSQSVAPLVLLAAISPWYVGACYGLCSTSVVLWWASFSGLPLAKPVGAYGAVIVPLLIVAVLAARIRTSQAESEEQLGVLGQASHEAQCRRLLDRAMRVQGGLLTDTVLPFLERTAVQITPADRAQSRILTAALRDELAVPGSIDLVLSRRLQVRRAAGVEVTIVAASDTDVEVSSSLRLLDRCLDNPDVTKVVLWVPTSEHPVARLLVHPPLSPEASERVLAGAADLPARWSDEGVASMLELRVMPVDDAPAPADALVDMRGTTIDIAAADGEITPGPVA